MEAFPTENNTGASPPSVADRPPPGTPRRAEIDLKLKWARQFPPRSARELPPGPGMIMVILLSTGFFGLVVIADRINGISAGQVIFVKGKSKNFR